jgi:predicted PilT family ATPase
MKIDKLYFELNQIIYFMNTLEILKKSTNTDTLIDSKKIIFLFESTIDEIIGRSEKLQKKLDKNYGVEIDIRDNGKELIVVHDPYKKGILLDN